MLKIKNCGSIVVCALATFLPISFIHSTTGGGAIQTCGNMVAGSNQNVRDQDVNCGSVKTSSSGKSFNAAGDKVNWGDTSKEQKNVEKWGTVSSTKSYTLNFPTAGEKHFITLTPTKGRLSNKEVHILLVSFDKRSEKTPDKMTNVPASVVTQFEELRANTEFNSMVKIYRKTATETNWTELYELFSNDYPNSRNLRIKVSVLPEGIIKTEQSVEFTDEDQQKHTVKPFQVDLASFE
jgi:hypothetical protein